MDIFRALSCPSLDVRKKVLPLGITATDVRQCKEVD